MSVPFVDLGPSCGPLNQAILADVADLLDSGRFHYGPQVTEFEEQFAAVLRRRALRRDVQRPRRAAYSALIAAGLEQGDEVIVPGEHVRRDARGRDAGRRRPRPVDVRRGGLNLDPDAGRARPSPGARASSSPSISTGSSADMRPHRESPATRAAVIEDACQAHGRRRDGLRAGTAGARRGVQLLPRARTSARWGTPERSSRTTTSLPSAAARCASTGSVQKYQHEFEGYTARLDTIQAIVLLRKLPLSTSWNDERRAAARFYLEALEGVGDLRLPPVPAGSEPVWHLFVVRTARPGGARGAPRRTRRIGTGRHYPAPGSSLRGVRVPRARPKGAFPVSRETWRATVLSLPIFPGHARGRSRARGRGRRAIALRTMADGPANEAPFRLIVDVDFGEGVVVHSFTNLYGCSDRRRHADRAVRRDPARRVDRRRAARSRATRSSATASTIEDEVFVGHGVMFVNDKRPRPRPARAS